MNREQIIRILAGHVSPHEAMALIREYIFEKRGVSPNINSPNPYDIRSMQLFQHAFDVALGYYQAKFNINVLKTKNKDVLKIY